MGKRGIGLLLGTAHKKGQMTVIILIVIALVAMFGVMFFLTTSRTEEKGESEIARQFSSEKIESVNEYVMSCLSISASESLELLGKQGGKIFQNQDGLIPEPGLEDIGVSYAEYEGGYIAYGITPPNPNSNLGGFYFSDPPEYPWETFPFLIFGDTDFGERYDGYFGMNRLSRLKRPLPDSMQEQLEFTTTAKFLNCLDWDTFSQRGMEVKAEGEPSLILDFGADDISFILEYPLAVTDLATGAQTAMEDFVNSIPVRLSSINIFLNKIIDNDITDISYNLINESSEGAFSVIIFKDAHEDDDLVIVRDANSQLLGSSYEFRFMRKNRNPALHYIDQQMIDSYTFCQLSNFSFSGDTMEINNSCGDNLELEFDASDPDEDNITFSFDRTLYPMITAPVAQAGSLEMGVIASDASLQDSQQIIFTTEWQ